MIAYIVQRALLGVLVLALISGIIFVLMRLMPGDPAAYMAGPGAQQADIDRIREVLGLDRPLTAQYFSWIRRLVTNSEISIYTRRLVTVEIAERMKYTFPLAVSAMILALGMGIPLGCLTALKRGSRLARALTSVSILAISTPAYLIGVLLISQFAVRLRLLPVGGATSLIHWILPVTTLTLTRVGTIIRTTTASVMESLDAEYTRTALAKGLSSRCVLFHHILKNSLIPITAVVGVELGALLAGTAVTEVIFTWPGLGRLMVEAVQTRDFPLIQSLVLFFGALFVLLNTLVDLMYSALDPRIRYG